MLKVKLNIRGVSGLNPFPFISLNFLSAAATETVRHRARRCLLAIKTDKYRHIHSHFHLHRSYEFANSPTAEFHMEAKTRRLHALKVAANPQQPAA